MKESSNKNNITKKKKKEKTESEKISEYYTKISKFQLNHYSNFLQRYQYCDICISEEWVIGYIIEINNVYISVLDIEKYYIYNVNTPIQIYFSEASQNIAYFRKYTRPTVNTVIKERINKNDIAKRIKLLQQDEFRNIFNDNKSIIKDENQVYKIYNFLRSTLYMGFDLIICKSKDKNNGVEEGFKIILIILEYLSEFYKYINNNLDEFINYKNEISISELDDIVLLEKKYAIFSFWDDANLLMSKIFLNNENYLEWFCDSEKILQIIIPSSPHFQKGSMKYSYPLYNYQIKDNKNNNENIYRTFFGKNITLNKICYKNNYDLNKNHVFINKKLPTYIIAYFIDFFYALGGFDTIFALSRNSSNIFIYENILENIYLTEEFTDFLNIKFEAEKNSISSNLMRFMEELNESNYIKYNKNFVIKLLKKGCYLLPNKNKKNNFFFEELYLRYILNLFLFEKKENKKNEILNDIINILNSIEYNDLIKKKNLDEEKIKNEKYNKRDKNINEMAYFNFCLNLKNNKIIENIFNSPNLTEEIIEKIIPLLKVLYQNNFGYEFPDRFYKDIKEIKNLIFNTIFIKLKTDVKNDLNNFKKLLNILSDYCEVFSEEDKYFIFSEIKTNFYNEKNTENDIFKLIIDFFINFTSTAVQKINEEKKEEIKNENNFLIFDEKQFYALELIYEFLLEEKCINNELNINEKQKEEMINISIDGIVKIIYNSFEQKIVLNIVLTKINNSIKNNKDIIHHLLLLQKLVNKYNTNINDNIKILDENLSKNNLFILLTSELKELLTKKDINSNNIKIRIESIFSLIPNCIRINFDFNYVKEFIQLITNYNEFSRDICFECLFNCMNNFSQDFLFYINSDIISNKKVFNIRNLKAYKIYKEIIIKINMINNSHFLYYNKDIIIQINENTEIDNEIKGIDILWNLILNEEQNIDINIIDDITDFICDIFFGVRIKAETNLITAYQNFYKDFINNISQKLNSFIISKKKTKNIKAIKSLILLIKKIINRTKEINGELIFNVKDLIQINNLNDDNAVVFTFFGKKALSDSLYFCDLKLRRDECFHTLRYTLSSLYKIPANQISISVYMNNLGKSELNQKNLDTITKAPPLKQFNLINDFDNIYQQLKGSLDFSQNKKKSSLLIHVKYVKNIWDKIFKINPVNIIYNKSKLPLMFLSLLKTKEENYIFNIINLIKDNKDLFNKAIITEIENEINQNKEDLFNIENSGVYYINYILDNLYEIISKKYDLFIKSNLLNNYILKLNIINDNEYSFNIKEKENLPSLNDLYQKYKACNNLIKIYQSICINEKDENLFTLIVFKLLNIYYYVINDSIYINLTKCETSEVITIDKVKNLYDEILNNINEIIINIEKIKLLIINCLINNNNNKNNNNIYLNKIKNIFMYISFDGIIKNKYSFINKRIKSLIFEIIMKYNNNNLFFEYLYDFYLTEKAFNKLINVFKEISKENNNENINIKRYEQNTKSFFVISSQILLFISGFIKDKLNLVDYINKILEPKIFNYSQYIKQNFNHDKNNNIFPQLIIGGACKLYDTVLMLTNIDINKEKYEFIFNNIIMPNIKENILTLENINNFEKDKEKYSFYFSSKFCIEEASKLFISFLFKNNNINNNIYNEYLIILNKYHNLNHWKGNLLSDWKLYYKKEEKNTEFIGLKNLGSTCYINTILQIFYNIPLLRDAILNCEIVFSEGKNCLYQLKKVFYCLKYLLINYYVPSSFIENLDDEIKINPNNQMDIFEFFSDFIEKLEKKLKNSPNENIIKYFFMGIQNNIITFDKSCQHNRINQSNFYTIELQVQNKLNLYQSLDALIEGEKMEGENSIFCDKCNQKIPAVKSQNFQELPRILIFVLKRFGYNNDTKQKFKINDYYEFPLELNMNKYIQNNKTNNLFKLKSIVIHKGNCERGHYYCYINNDKNNQWYEFNDIKISKFDINNLDNEAFGNEIILEKNIMIEKENDKNAYMLFYEKVDFNSGIIFDNIKAINDIKENKNIQLKEEEINDILNPINKEMYEYFLNKRLFSGEYHHFVLSLFINILNIYKSSNKKLSFINNDLCTNNNNYILGNDIKLFRHERMNLENSNLYNYLLKNKIVLINKAKNNNQKDNKEKILELFKYLIIYFFNVMIRSREKDYLGGTVDLIKFFINNYIYCSDYLIEEFTNQNVLLEYIVNCPSYDMKKLIVGIIYCAMINCVKSYENKMRKENVINKNNNKIPEKNVIKVNNIQSRQIMSDEELARKLQEEEDLKYYRESFNEVMNYNDMNNNINIQENINPLERKYIPVNVLKLIYNIFYLLDIINYKNMNESRFLYLILYRFSTISKKCKKFLLNKAYFLEFLNLLLYSQINRENHDENKILTSINTGYFKSTHSILSKNEDNIKPIDDKGGNYHYENYISDLHFYLLSHNQKPKAKKHFFEGSHNFNNDNFILSLFVRINSKLDAYVFSYLIIQKCKDIKNYKNRITFILGVLIKILNFSDFNEKIDYDINVNNNMNSNTITINPKYVLLILKKFLLTSSENKIIDEFRITQILTKIILLIENNHKYYNYCIHLIDFITELFLNYISILYLYIPHFSPKIKHIIEWIRLNPISPELYPINNLFMYKKENIVYNNNITTEEKKNFIEKNMKKAELRINKLLKILEYKNNKFDKDYSYETLLDFTDFKFRKNDIIFYKKNKAVVKESLDELILIKLIDNNKNGDKDLDEDTCSIDDIEKNKFWIAKDDKNITVFNLE